MTTNTATASLSAKLHALWDNLDAEERRVFALAARVSPDDEVAGFTEMVHLYMLLPALATVDQMVFTNDTIDKIQSPRDIASGQATGRRQHLPLN